MSTLNKKFEGKKDNEIAAELYAELGSKSKVIRYLAASGWARGRIAKSLDIKYQFVRNVLVREAKKPAIQEMVEGDLGIE